MLSFFFRGLVQSFESLARQKQIDLSFEASSKYVTAFVDRDKFEIIINNLLSNAFKFTPQWGKIRVAVNNLHPVDKSVSPLEKGD